MSLGSDKSFEVWLKRCEEVMGGKSRLLRLMVLGGRLRVKSDDVTQWRVNSVSSEQTVCLWLCLCICVTPELLFPCNQKPETDGTVQRR